MFILKTGHQPGVYVPLRALFLVFCMKFCFRVLKLRDGRFKGYDL